MFINSALESQLRGTEFVFTSAEIKDDHKQVESGEKGNTSEQPEADLKTLTAERQGRLLYNQNTKQNKMDLTKLEKLYNIQTIHGYDLRYNAVY